MPTAPAFRSRLVAREPLYGAWSWPNRPPPSPSAGKPAGVHAADGGTARRYREAGCTLITTAVDATAITRDTAAQLSLAQGA